MGDPMRVGDMSCDVAGCKAEIVDFLAARGIEAHVTTTAPLGLPSYEDLHMRCPHGVLWHAQPTPEQVLAWVADGVE